MKTPSYHSLSLVTTICFLCVSVSNSYTTNADVEKSQDGHCNIDGDILQCNGSESKSFLQPSQIGLCRDCGFIKTLKMENGSLKVIRKRHLQRYPSISTFSAKNNLIVELFDRIFSKSRSLKHADLSHNFIAKMDSIALYGAFRLETLDLSNNRINRLPMLIFEKLRNLRTLRLQRNRISLLFPESFHGLGKLEFLDISFNDIRFIDEQAFKGLRNLQMLDLRGNRVKRLTPSVLLHLPALRTLRVDTSSVQKHELLSLDGEHIHRSTKHELKRVAEPYTTLAKSPIRVRDLTTQLETHKKDLEGSSKSLLASDLTAPPNLLSSKITDHNNASLRAVIIHVDTEKNSFAIYQCTNMTIVICAIAIFVTIAFVFLCVFIPRNKFTTKVASSKADEEYLLAIPHS